MVKENGMAIFLLRVLSQPNMHVMMLTQVGGGHPDGTWFVFSISTRVASMIVCPLETYFRLTGMHYVVLNDRQLSPNDVAYTNLCLSSNISFLSRLDSSVPRYYVIPSLPLSPAHNVSNHHIRNKIQIKPKMENNFDGPVC